MNYKKNARISNMKIFNSKSKTLEEFVPLQPKRVKMYVCGITPYDTTHIGHAATYMFFDAVRRFLEFKGFKVEYVQNVTDVDDSILQKAREVKRDWKELGDYWTGRFLKDLKDLNVALPTHLVKATDSIPKIIEIVRLLSQKGFTYQKGGNVYFEVSRFPDYGKLSNYSPHQMVIISKERGADPGDPNKKDPLDFILWQKSLPDEPFWDSPWGKGRPGWHIECSAMVNQYLGDQIDIHGGGADLIYPHHESEIAQSESYIGKSPFVKYWIHIGMVYYQGEKMSKSLGNLVLVKDLLKKYEPNIIRWMLLSHHYNSKWEFKIEAMDAVMQKFDRIKTKLNRSEAEIPQKFLDSIENDFDFPLALKVAENAPHPGKMLEILGFDLR